MAVVTSECKECKNQQGHGWGGKQDKDDTEEILETVPEELMNGELLELEQECIAEEEGR